MTRSLVIREPGHSGERLVEESAVPTEAALHEVLMRHPSLVPSTDLGFGRVVTVGFEATLASGSADLVLLDEEGRLCVVEVKKEGNPDTRRVVAQLLDYASALWGLTVDEFERDVLRRMLSDNDPSNLREFIAEQLHVNAADPEEAADRTVEALGETLRSGDFALVLAAPTIPTSIQRVIEYLNARGLSVFGLEVSYFAGDVEAFVPRLVVKPSVGGRIAGQDPQKPKETMEPEAFYGSLPEGVEQPVREFIGETATVGGELQWKNYGLRIRVRGESGPKVVVSMDPDFLYLAVSGMKGLDPESGRRASERMGEIDGSKVGPTYARLKWEICTPEKIDQALGVARRYVKEASGNDSVAPWE